MPFGIQQSTTVRTETNTLHQVQPDPSPQLEHHEEEDRSNDTLVPQVVDDHNRHEVAQMRGENGWRCLRAD